MTWYAIGAALSGVFTIVGLTIYYLKHELDRGFCLYDFMFASATLLIVFSLLSWASLIIGLAVLTTVYIYKKYKGNENEKQD